jgi:hypothetical protein
MEEVVSHTRVTKRWTTDELLTMRRNATLGAIEVAHQLGRSVSCVRRMAARQRISLRSAGMRRGLVLGQPRGVSIAAQIRDDIVSGKVSAESLARRMALKADAALCPCCAHRPAEVRSSGFCLKCHNDRLIAAHLQALEDIDSQRALWTSRTTLCRARKEAQA